MVNIGTDRRRPARLGPVPGELKEIADLALFAKIVQAGSISRCATLLGLERTTVSRRLANLERTVGARLLDRTPKSLVPTDAGRRCFRYCEELLIVAERARLAANSGAVSESVLPVRIGAPPDVINEYLETALEDFESENPNFALERQPMYEFDPNSSDAVDLVIGWSQHGFPAQARKLTDVLQSTYASPEYLEKFGAPDSPYDIEKHACIVDSQPDAKCVWRFQRGSDSVKIAVDPRYVVSGLLEAREATLSGLGLSQLPDHLCRTYVESGRLTKVLEDYRTFGRSLYVAVISTGVARHGAAALRISLEDRFRERTPT